MTMHVGLIGAGNITVTHARAALAIPGVELAAIFGDNAEKVHRLGKEYGAATYTDFNRFLAHRPMTFVVIGSPSGVHAVQGIAAARRGLHVLTEKPIDISTRSTDELILETDKAGVKLGVIYQDRFKPGIRFLKELYTSGKLGTPILTEARVKWYRAPEYYSESRAWSCSGRRRRSADEPGHTYCGPSSLAAGRRHGGASANEVGAPQNRV